MNLDVADFAGRLRDARWERELARELRARPEAERFEFLRALLDVQHAVALDLARKCLSERRSFESLLEQGLREADASSIRDWLECVTPKLGPRRVAAFLKKFAPVYPDGVRHAEYWLPGVS